MKPIQLSLMILAAGILTAAAQNDSNAPSSATVTVTVTSNNAPTFNTVTVVSNATVAITTNGAGTTSLTAGQTLAVTNAPVVTNNVPALVEDVADIPPTNQVRMNFHDAPLNTVLKYLSKRLGLVVVSEVEVRGNATIVSEQPVTTPEVVTLLSGALAKNGYAVSTNGRVLTITSTDTATTGSETPVVQAASATNIPMNDQMATYILPVHTLNPTQLIKDLDQLIPSGAKVAANEAGNAVIMTARQRDIRRFAEIINALDSSSVSEVEVYILKYADAKSVASELKEIFQSPDSNVSKSDARQRFGRGGGFGFGGFGGGGGGGGDNNTETKNASDKAVFVSDDQQNAVVASAPPDYFPMITNVIGSLDQPSQEITVIRCFKLEHADAQEMADELSNLFPDDTKTSDQSSSRSLGMRFMPPWMQQPAATSGQSDRMKLQTSVRVVPDLRTGSVIVTCSKDLVDEIAGIIEVLDKDLSQVKHVYSIDIDSADPTTVQATMAALFQSQNARNTQNNNNQSALQSREQSTAQQQQTQTTTSGFGTSGGSSALH